VASNSLALLHCQAQSLAARAHHVHPGGYSFRQGHYGGADGIGRQAQHESAHSIINYHGCAPVSVAARLVGFGNRASPASAGTATVRTGE